MPPLLSLCVIPASSITLLINFFAAKPRIRLITSATTIMIRAARARLRFCSLRHPPQAQTIIRIWPITGIHIKSMMPIKPPVVISSYLLPAGGMSEVDAA